MIGKRCCCGSMCLCPVSFGLAVGITSFLAVFIWGVWMMHGGMPHMARDIGMPLTWGATFAASVWALVKGFIFAFVVAFIYDFFACYLKSKCMGKGKYGSDKDGCCCFTGKGDKKRH